MFHVRGSSEMSAKAIQVTTPFNFYKTETKEIMSVNRNRKTQTIKLANHNCFVHPAQSAGKCMRTMNLLLAAGPP